MTWKSLPILLNKTWQLTLWECLFLVAKYFGVALFNKTTTVFEINKFCWSRVLVSYLSYLRVIFELLVGIMRLCIVHTKDTKKKYKANNPPGTILSTIYPNPRDIYIFYSNNRSDCPKHNQIKIVYRRKNRFIFIYVFQTTRWCLSLWGISSHCAAFFIVPAHAGVTSYLDTIVICSNVLLGIPEKTASFWIIQIF